MKYWLMKSEPEAYSIDDLEKDGKTHWDGVRNYQARNFMMKDMKKGDKVLFYHSNANPPGVVGVAEVCSEEAYPDFTQFDAGSKYFDAKAPKDKPRWYMVDIKFVKKFREMVSLEEVKGYGNLQNMPLVQRGQRLSVQPVGKEEFEFLVRLRN